MDNTGKDEIDIWTLRQLRKEALEPSWEPKGAPLPVTPITALWRAERGLEALPEAQEAGPDGDGPVTLTKEQWRRYYAKWKSQRQNKLPLGAIKRP